jgi:peptidoglycan-N-acetylglucosamine deacetylase
VRVLERPVLVRQAKSPPDPGRILLTFDDGPDPNWTPRILDLLATAGCRATFFMVGLQALRHPGLVRRVVADGHEIGNHSWSHRNPWTMATPAARREVSDGAAAIADAAGIAPRYFRPPYGRVRACMIQQAEHHGERLMLWTLSARDWGLFGASCAAIKARLDRARAGDIVLMHDAPRGINRPDQLIRVLPDLLRRVTQHPPSPRSP